MPVNQPRTTAPDIRSGYNGTGSTILKGKIVKLVTSPTRAGQVTPATAASDPLYGVAMADILTGEFGDIQVGGIALVRAGATVTAPALITADGDGDGITATTGNKVIGNALTGGASTELIEVELNGGNQGTSA